MDAQNAVEPASTKPAAASPKRPGTETDQPKSSAVNRSPSNSKALPSGKESKPAAGTNSGTNDEGEANSDAETIVLPGKDGHSPSKVRKIIKHEENSDAEARPAGASVQKRPAGTRDRDAERGGRSDKSARTEKAVSVGGPSSTDQASSAPTKKKRLLERQEKPRNKDASSGLSSAPASPPPQRRRRSSNVRPDSDSESAHAKSPKASAKEKSRSLDRSVPPKRKAPRAGSDDEGENRKVRRQRTSAVGLDASHQGSRSSRDNKASISSRAAQDSRVSQGRSVSPLTRTHRRSVSTQLPGQSTNGLSQKKKRIPAPLHTTEYHSDDSSASGSPHPRSSKLRSLATPATAESNISPAKLAPHKKHLDAHGQTFLARACARGEFEIAKQRLQERPEDINVADYAGNTPLQIASINGLDDIVKLLLEAGCALDCVNFDKDTPLLDAVENGHLTVVKLLLNAGVNPRKANAYGEEPLDRITDEIDNAVEIRAALEEAKSRMRERRRTSEDNFQDQTDGLSSHGPESPRRSPGAPGSNQAGSNRRPGTVRSTKTSNHLLYMPMDDKTLRSAAARGDEETVTRILQVRDKFDDPESMVAAARGGHEIVMQLLLALGNANPDPGPIASNEFSTPMLAAIGQEDSKVIRLLLDQNNFNPTRLFKGETYYEIARRRRGPNWEEEERMLKEAYDEAKKNRKESKTKSPKRDQEREARRAATVAAATSKLEAKDEAAKSHKRKGSSPTREAKKLNTAKVTSPREKRRSDSSAANPDEQTSPKRVPARPRKEERAPVIGNSDREASPATAKAPAKPKRTESDIAGSSEGEALKPRRKLISGRELKDERERIRRPSIVSNASSLKEPSSPHESRQDDRQEKQPKSEKYHDRTKALKRDESRDRFSVTGENSGKRHRASATPPHNGTDKESGEVSLKRRRLDVDNGKEKRQKLSSSPDDRHHKTQSGRDTASLPNSASKAAAKDKDEEERKTSSKPKRSDSKSAADHGRRESGKSSSSEKSIHVKSEDPDVDMPDADAPADEDTELKAQLEKTREEEELKKQADREAKVAEEARKKEEGRKKEEEEKEKEKRRREEEEAKRRAEEEAKRRAEEEAKRRAEEEQKQREAEERKRKEEEERKIQEEQRKRREEEERLKREEEEKRRLEEEEKKRLEEEERKKREEEERMRREQLEREAAEEARRIREEEERKERERKEQAMREEQERRRAQREAERQAKLAEERRLHLEQERIRLSKLPPLLRWLDGCANPKEATIAEKFSMMQGVRYDCIRPAATGCPDGREQWLLNTQVALLLGEKDLELSRYTAWERIPVSDVAKRIIWRLESDRYALTTPSVYDIGRQLPGYYGGEDPERIGYRVIEQLRGEAWAKFSAMDMFFVKASDLMFIIPTIPHLRNVKLTIAYRELPEHESQLASWVPLQKWKSDPDADRFMGFAPGKKYFLNGTLLREEQPGMSPMSKVPFPEKRVPRRGLVAVSADDPEYARLCREQGLDGSAAASPLLPNGVHSSPVSATSGQRVHDTNGAGSPSPAVPRTVNGNGPHPISPASDSGTFQARPLVNGINGTNHSDAE